jgi:hypothetical protein
MTQLLQTIRTSIAYHRLPRIVRDELKRHALHRNPGTVSFFTNYVRRWGPVEAAAEVAEYVKMLTPLPVIDSADYQRMAWARPRDAAGRFMRRVDPFAQAARAMQTEGAP